jgi:flagellar motor switch protein FliG
MSAEGFKKTAMILMALGEDEAAEVLKFLPPRNIQKLGSIMASTKQLGRNEINEVLLEFRRIADTNTDLGVDSTEYLRAVLTKALGDDKAANLIERILHGGDTSGLDGLKWMDSPTIVEMIRNEHPQIIAAILVHLERDQAAEILDRMNERTRNDVMLRIARIEGIQPAALRELNDVLMTLLAGGDTVRRKSMGGVNAAAEILNFLGTAHEQIILDNIRLHDSDLAEKIADQMFTFEDILTIDDRGIQALLKEVESETLVVALKGSPSEMREKFLRNMSTRAAELFREDLETRGPVRVSDVEVEQRKILQIIKKLADAGQIMLGGKGDEAFV